MRLLRSRRGRLGRAVRTKEIRAQGEASLASGHDETQVSAGEAGPDAPVAAGDSELEPLGVIESYGGRIEGALTSTGTLVVHGEVRGNITVDGDVFVSAGSAVEADIRARSISAGGSIKGNVSTPGDVELPPRGRVDGDIHARCITVHGVVNGHIRAEERVHLAADAKVRGDISCKTLVVAGGAVFLGQSDMTEASEAGSGEIADAIVEVRVSSLRD